MWSHAQNSCICLILIKVSNQYLYRLCGLVVRVPGCWTEIYCVSCEVRTEFICYVEESRPPLCSSGQSSWLQSQRSGFDSRHYQIFWEAVGLEQGPLSLVSTIEELFERKISSPGLENRAYSRRNPSRWPRYTLYPQNLALTSLTSGGLSVGIVRSRTQATEFQPVFALSHISCVHSRPLQRELPARVTWRVEVVKIASFLTWFNL
jgi:hypothetical protein